MSDAFHIKPECQVEGNPERIVDYTIPAPPEPVPSCTQFPFDIPLPDPADFSFGCYLPVVSSANTAQPLQPAQSAGGYVTGGGAAGADSTIVLTAVPYQGWTVTYWTDQNDNHYLGTTDPTTGVNTLTVQASNNTYTAHFAKKQTTITAQSIDAAAGTVAVLTYDNDGNPITHPLSAAYDVGTILTLTATANAGYVFDRWSDGNSNSSRQIQVPSQSQTYTALFASSAEMPYKISVIAESPASNNVEATATVSPVDGDNCKLDFKFDFRIPDLSLVIDTRVSEHFYALSPGNGEIIGTDNASTNTTLVCTPYVADRGSTYYWFEVYHGETNNLVWSGGGNNPSAVPEGLKLATWYYWWVWCITPDDIIKLAENQEGEGGEWWFMLAKSPILRWGTLTSDYTGGPTFTLQPSTEFGTALNTSTGSTVPLITCAVLSGGSPDLTKVYTEDGTVDVDCKLTAGTIIPYTVAIDQANANNSTNISLLTDENQVLAQWRFSDGKVQGKFYYHLGCRMSTVSDWVTIKEYDPVTVITDVSLNEEGLVFNTKDIYVLDSDDADNITIENEPSKVTSCDEPGV